MAPERPTKSPTPGKAVVQLNLVGLVVLCVALVLAAGLLAGLLTYGLLAAKAKSGNDKPHPPASDAQTNSFLNADVPPAEVPPWGEMHSRDIELEQPEEYAAFAMDTNKVATWTFGGMTMEQVRALMSAGGLTPDQIQRALSPEFASVMPSGIVITPDDDLVLSLSPQTRAKLYHELARDPVNGLIRYPFCYPNQSFEAWVRNAKIDDTVASLIKRLLYPRGNAQCFSDYEVVLRRVPSDPERLHLLKGLSRQPAVLAWVRVRQDTDIDKLLGYWDRGISVKDVRPLLESVQRVQDGGAISLLYLLPPFARERLYTFPRPSKPGDPFTDCHWSTMNFFNDPPDNRFADGNYATAYISTNYYEVAKPTVYGDLVFLLDEHGAAFHSAVYIADDIVFTKNGNSFTQPWTLVRLKDLVALYALEPAERVVVYRNKNW